ncbi:MAG: hypothetical protein U0905_11005 [Pirellulales bacterium]
MPNHALVMEQTSFDLGIVPTGEHFVQVPIKNQTTQGRRILGIDGMCDDVVCYGPADGQEGRMIEKLARTNISLWLLVKKPAPFRCEIGIYLDDFGAKRHVVTIEGVGQGDSFE